ncbi:alcohol dehydrogenase [Burkholderia sp. Leaf177]|uniref:alcohol dehydrogenase n=1 Tax=Burkholderia sp. Leaf177 TaxID=1736287 RepID=UPI000B0B34E4|nr:alcohol dehydrogenase [Burkholderia sp. Leaf177]
MTLDTRPHQFQMVANGAALVRAEVEMPQPKGTEVTLRVLAAGVCHTDLHLIDGFFDLGRGKRISMADRGIRMPHTLGHESVGEVIAMGPDVEGITVGQRVLAYPWIGCGACERCVSGEDHLCPNPRFLGVFRSGGFGTHLHVPEARFLFPLTPDTDPARAAPLACAGITAYSALTRARAHANGGPVVIIGAGGLGLMCLALIKLMGLPPAIVIEPNEEKRNAALELGASAAFGTSAEDALGIIETTHGGAAAVIDFVGSPASVERGASVLRKGAKLVIVGMFGGELSIPIPTLVLRALSVEGSYVGSPAEMRELMTLVAAKGLPALPVTRRPLSEVNAVLDAMRAGEVIGRTVLTPDFTSKEPQ